MKIFIAAIVGSALAFMAPAVAQTGIQATPAEQAVTPKKTKANKKVRRAAPKARTEATPGTPVNAAGEKTREGVTAR